MDRKKEEFALVMDQVSKSLGGQKRIDNLSVECEYGKIYGLIGPNGSGKTTFLKLITGLYKADKGDIKVCGQNPITEYKEVRKRFGLLPQDTALYPELSARDNLKFHGALYFENQRELKERIDVILKLIDLENRSKESVKNFSGGMKRRLGIGMALLNDPELIFFDEPTLGVDVHNSHRIWEYIRNLKAQNKTVIVTTNVMSEAENLCDEIIIINQGKKVCEGTPSELKDSIGTAYVEIKMNETCEDTELSDIVGEYQYINENTIRIQAQEGEKDLLRILEQTKGKIKLDNISLKNPTLDDVFLHYTGSPMEVRD